jgi:hypothetical protein
MFKKKNTYFFIFSLLASAIHAQPSASSGQPQVASAAHERDSNDSTKVKVHKHSPNAAMLMSLCVPGLGQVYNKKYWKVPIVYASMGTTLYFFNSNNKLYKQYKQAFINKTDTATSTLDTYPDYSDAQLKELESYYHKYRDLNVILTALFYTINVVDAYVDAHLMNFDVSDDLSLHVFPSMNFSAASKKPSAGLTLALRF